MEIKSGVWRYILGYRDGGLYHIDDEGNLTTRAAGASGGDTVVAVRRLGPARPKTFADPPMGEAWGKGEFAMWRGPYDRVYESLEGSVPQVLALDAHEYPIPSDWHCLGPVRVVIGGGK